MHRIIASPPTPEAGAALTDAWGLPALAVTYDPIADQVTVDAEARPDSWPGSSGDPAGPWRLVYSGPPEEPAP